MNVIKWTRGIRSKFLIMVAIPLVAIVALLIVSRIAFSDMSKLVSEFTQQSIPSALSLSALNSGLMTMTVDLHEASGATTKEDRTQFLANAQEEYTNFEKEIIEYQKYDMNAEEKVLFDKFTAGWKIQKALVDRVFTLIKNEDGISARNLLISDYSNNLHVIDKIFTGFDDLQTKSSTESEKEAATTVLRSNGILLAVGLSALLILIVVSLITVNAVIKNLTHVSESLTESSAQVGTSAREIAAASDALAGAATEQSASLEQTAAAVHEVNSMVARNSENSKNSSVISQQSLQKAQEGRDSATLMLQSMNDISESNESITNQVNRSNDQMAEIVKLIQEIGTKTKVINDIVFQTKLLSFNASVEAARAGENGKGFAVVAEEVGNLARMSGTAAEEISKMLEGSISKVESIVRESKSSVDGLVLTGRQKVQVGSDVAKSCLDVLNEIVRQVESVSSMSTDISSASHEQAQGVDEISKAVAQLNSVTQINSSSAEQAARAAADLSSQTDSLNTAVQNLIAVVDGGRRQSVNNSSITEPVHKEKSVKNNTVAFRPKKAAPVKLAKASLVRPVPIKKAAGDGSTPSRDHSGFNDV